MSTQVRDATEEDLPGIAEVSVASDTESGTDVQYVRHLMHDGTVAVAIADGRPIGFAAALPVGNVTMLADLFVRPDAQSAGAGQRLLDHVLAGSTDRMTCASHDPRAIALYTRAGMTARWAVLYLSGPALPPAGPTNPITVEQAAALEHAWTGADRRSSYRYWTAGGGTALAVGPSDQPVAVAAVGRGALRHLAVAPGADPAAAVRDALAASRAERVFLASVHPALPGLLADAWRITDFDLYMTSVAHPPEPTGVFHPGLA
jgi:GNAT superfamily N-acetyltransferase